MTQYYFETLPLHPPPEYLESCTSYAMRLAEANNLQTMASLSSCFFGEHNRVRMLDDNLPISLFHSFEIVANGSEIALSSTTFFHLRKKFGRSESPQSIVRFLSGTIASSLRYCPACISDRRYYSLLWRFLLIPGCVHHKCYLLDSCSRCGRSIPIFAAPFRIGICPFCKEDLRNCSSVSLTENDFYLSRGYSQDLTFLLSPQPWEADMNVERIGAYFATLRQNNHLTMKEVAYQTGLSINNVEGIEYGLAKGGGQLFKNYVAYAQFLRISLQEVFETTMLRNSPCRQKKERRSFSESEEQVIKNVYEAVQQLKCLGKPVTQRAISEIIGISTHRLNTFTKIKSILRQLAVDAQIDRKKRRDSHINEIFERVQKAIKDLESFGVPITQTAISERVGLSPKGLKYYPEIKELIEQYVAEHSYVVKRSALRELELVAKIEAAIAEMRACNLRLTQTAISRAVGLSLVGLKKSYPLVKTLLEQFAVKKQEREKPFCEDELYERVKEAIRHLKELAKNATLSAISKEVGISLSDLRCYPRVKTLLEQCSSELNSASRKKSLANEDRILAEVKKAIAQLNTSGMPITQKAIGEIVGISVSALRRYSRVYTLLMQVAGQYHLEQYRSEQANFYEDELVVKMEKAVELLESLGEPVTHRGVSRIMGLSASTLYLYPKLISRLKGIVSEKRSQSKLSRAKIREDELVTKVSEAIEQLQRVGQRVSVIAVARIVKVSDGMLRNYPRVMEILKQIP